MHYLPVPIVPMFFSHRLFSVFMQHPPIHIDGEDHPVVGKQPLWSCHTFPALICLLVFLCQGQDEFCPDGNTQDTRSKRTLNGLHLK